VDPATALRFAQDDGFFVASRWITAFRRFAQDDGIFLLARDDAI